MCYIPVDLVLRQAVSEFIFFCLCIKTSHRVEPFIWKWVPLHVHFHMGGSALKLVLLNTDYCLVHRNRTVQFRPVLSVTGFRRCRGASVKWIYLFRYFVSLKSRDKLFLYRAGSSNTRSGLSSPARRHFLSSTFTWQKRAITSKAWRFFFILRVLLIITLIQSGYA